MVSVALLSMSFFLSCPKENNVKEEKQIIEAKMLTELDGPYIYKEETGKTVIEVAQNNDGSFVINKVKNDKRGKYITKINNRSRDSISFDLMQAYKIPKAEYEAQGDIFVTSDIEGNFNAFYSLLVGNSIIDGDYNWTFGNGHLVICGDMFDRDTEVIPALWLLYKLEKEAEIKGGKVHYILGNHDVMNIHLDLRYVKPKYLELAKLVSGIDDETKAYEHLMSDTNELVKWIKTKNTIEKIGHNIFLHAGISQDLVNTGLSITEINDLVRLYIREDLGDNPSNDPNANLVQGSMGPLWYRGLIKARNGHYEKATMAEVDNILEFYNAKHIIIGHTIVSSKVTTDYNGKVIRIAIKHPKEKFSEVSSALLIEKNKYYRVNDKAEKIELKF